MRLCAGAGAGAGAGVDVVAGAGVEEIRLSKHRMITDDVGDLNQ